MGTQQRAGLMAPGKSTTTELAKLIDACIDQGWRVVRGRGGHYKCFPPDGATPMVTVGYSPSRTALRDIRQQLRRAGLRV